MERSTCGSRGRKGCGAEILWATTKDGKPQPLDAEPVKRVILVEGHDVDRLARDNPTEPGRNVRARVVDTYTPHHATCPEVSNFRAPTTPTQASEGGDDG